MSTTKGFRSTRRLMKRLPPAMRDELASEMRAAGPELLAAMTARTPKASGRLSRGLAWRFYPGTLRLRVGLIGKPVNRRLFYGWILNYGRKARVANARRHSKKTGKISSYTVNVRALAPRSFVTGPLTDLRTAFNRRLKGIWERALSRVAAGND